MAIIQKGSYTSTGVALSLNIVSDIDFMEVYIQGDASGSVWNGAGSPSVTKRATWFKGMSAGSAFTMINTNAAATDQSLFITTNGFTYYDGSDDSPNAGIVGTSITQANPAVVTINAHGYQTGDLVRLTNCTGMRQVEGLVFNITRTGANTFTIPLDTSGFAAAATAVTGRKLPIPPEFSPRRHSITVMTQANPLVITTSDPHGYSAGAQFRIIVPNGWGMTQANGLLARAVSVTSTTITTDIDSSAFTAFAFPTSASMPLTFPQVVPVGEIATILTEAEDNTAFRGITLGTSVCGPNGAKVYWIATKVDAVQTA